MDLTASTAALPLPARTSEPARGVAVLGMPLGWDVADAAVIGHALSLIVRSGTVDPPVGHSAR